MLHSLFIITLFSFVYLFIIITIIISAEPRSINVASLLIYIKLYCTKSFSACFVFSTMIYRVSLYFIGLFVWIYWGNVINLAMMMVIFI